MENIDAGNWPRLYSQVPRKHLSHTMACRYRKKARQLFIQFDNGDVYSYEKVPWAIYMGFRRAKSHGSYFSRKIRDRFPYQRLTP
jgi:KTSC domain